MLNKDRPENMRAIIDLLSSQETDEVKFSEFEEKTGYKLIVESDLFTRNFQEWLESEFLNFEIRLEEKDALDALNKVEFETITANDNLHFTLKARNMDPFSWLEYHKEYRINDLLYHCKVEKDN